MKQNFNISISKPCSEQFNTFKQTQSGGFCKSCKKEVIDFRNMSDKQLVTYFPNKQEKACGFFKASQLKDYPSVKINEKKSRFKLASLVGFTVFSMLSFHNVQAQDKKHKTEIVQTINEKQNPLNNKAAVQQKLLTGVISDEAGPVPGANIVLKGTSIGVASDFDGRFEFPQALKEGDVLVISYLGYETQTIVIKNEQETLNVPLEVSLKADTCVLMGEVEVNEVYKSKRTLWQKIKGIF